MSKNNRVTPADPLSPGSFISPRPTTRTLYDASSQSSQGTTATDVLSQATEVLSQATDVLTPPLSPRNAEDEVHTTPYPAHREGLNSIRIGPFMENGEWKSRVQYHNGTFGVLPSDEYGRINTDHLHQGAAAAEAASASASASASSSVNRPLPLLKPTAASGDRGGGLFRRNGKYWISYIDEDTNAYIVQPADSEGNVVSIDDLSHTILENVVNLRRSISNTPETSAILVRHRNPREIASSASASTLRLEEPASNQRGLFSSSSSALNNKHSPRKPNNQNPNRNRNLGGKRRTLHKQRKQRTLRKYRKQHKQRKQNKETQRKKTHRHRSRRSRRRSLSISRKKQ
jgi:hypothetical protein